MEAKIYNQAAQVTGQIDLPTAIFGVPENPDLVHQVVTAFQANLRRGTAKTKGRGEVRGGGKKPWQQKGTGRARHGSIRSPLWKGGGVTHGPTGVKIYHQKVNQKMSRRALATILSSKYRHGEIMFVDDLARLEPKTKTAAGWLGRLAAVPGFEKLTYRQGKRALLTLPKADDTAEKAFRNLEAVTVATVDNLNPLATWQHDYIIFVEPNASLAALTKRLS